MLSPTKLKRYTTRALRLLQTKPYEPIPFTRKVAERHAYFTRMYAQIEYLEGNIVECGVGHGRSLFSWCALTSLDMHTRELWAFDSFEGFPEPTGHDASDRNPQAGEWGNTSIEFVKNYLRASEIDPAAIESIKFVKGFFQDTMSQYTGEAIALLHLDGDLYESYRVCLESLYDYVVPGGLILFDEYIDQESKFPGAVKAIHEFFGKDKDRIVRLPQFRKAYFVKPQ